MGDKLRFNDDDHGELYEPTDSEDNYSEEERELLKKVRQGNRAKQDPKQEVFAFDESDDNGDDDDDEEDDDDVGKLMADSDIEGAEDDEADLPDRRAWGSKSSNFYNTDFVDPDYSSYTDKEREMALAEEEEALAIQKRQALEMKEENFIFDILPDVTSPSSKYINTDSDEDDTNKKITEQSITTKSKKVAGTGVTKFKMSLGGLSKGEKLEIFHKDSPEFFGLVEDLQMGLNECGNLLTPVINYAKTHKLPNIPALEFAEVMNTLLTTYCSNINFYLMLKANRISIKTHPIINRLLQLKEMHEQLSDKYENIIKPQLEALLERIEDGDVFEILVPEQSNKQATSKKRIKSSNQSEGADDLKLQQSSDDANTEDDENAVTELANAEDERRSITYQISKNKGLTPHRKKELRNPRVKHRSKFRKALIRRKGAVRTVRTETKRYGGEVSGIKATVSKSVKFK